MPVLVSRAVRAVQAGGDECEHWRVHRVSTMALGRSKPPALQASLKVGPAVAAQDLSHKRFLCRSLVRPVKPASN